MLDKVRVRANARVSVRVELGFAFYSRVERLFNVLEKVRQTDPSHSRGVRQTDPHARTHAHTHTHSHTHIHSDSHMHTHTHTHTSQDNNGRLSRTEFRRF